MFRKIFEHDCLPYSLNFNQLKLWVINNSANRTVEPWTLQHFHDNKLITVWIKASGKRDEPIRGRSRFYFLQMLISKQIVQFKINFLPIQKHASVAMFFAMITNYQPTFIVLFLIKIWSYRCSSPSSCNQKQKLVCFVLFAIP